ncbi:SUMF1/EgtB/PvdO family nonheme iron enzyme [bacterium]|nr:SUMF1/EgtB/PvdO family nonheme iron enzyme [candidate division CSSED10-310 bacterium]
MDMTGSNLKNCFSPPAALSRTCRTPTACKFGGDCSIKRSMKGEGRGGSNRVKRGGNWNNNAQSCRSANRNNNTPGNRNNNLGFRLLNSTFARCNMSTDVLPVHQVDQTFILSRWIPGKEFLRVTGE